MSCMIKHCAPCGVGTNVCLRASSAGSEMESVYRLSSQMSRQRFLVKRPEKGFQLSKKSSLECHEQTPMSAKRHIDLLLQPPGPANNRTSKHT